MENAVPTPLAPRPSNYPIILVAAAVFMVAVLRFAWISDDAFIAAKAVANFLHGHGLVINPGFRVQAYTSPLFTLLDIPTQVLARGPYFGLMILGLLSSLALCTVLARSFKDHPWTGVAILTIATASPIFLTYSTSGLENPLAHALVAAWVVRLAHQKDNEPDWVLLLLSALIVLTRFDLAVLLLPGLVRIGAFSPRKAIRKGLTAFSPLALWLVAATVYYGFPWPNTAYAKLNTIIPLKHKLLQGLTYLADAAYRDPVLAIVVFGGTFIGLTLRGPIAKKMVPLGCLAYLVYVVNIGGDFMAGRFLTVPFVALLVHFAMLPGNEAPQRILQGITIVALLFSTRHFSEQRVVLPTECYVNATGVVDERACYVEHTGLVQNLKHATWKDHGYVREYITAVNGTGGNVIVFDLVGLVGFANTRPMHIVERFALSEPLLARLPFVAKGADWRPGHYHRELPDGYLETLRTGQNLIKKKCIRGLYDDLKPVITGPLWTFDRWRRIARLNFKPPRCR
jgi:arabinofuranosyltransferase